MGSCSTRLSADQRKCPSAAVYDAVLGCHVNHLNAYTGQTLAHPFVGVWISWASVCRLDALCQKSSGMLMKSALCCITCKFCSNTTQML